MNTVFLVKEGYPDFDVLGVYPTLGTAKGAVEYFRKSFADEFPRSSHTKLKYIIEEWIVGSTIVRSICQLEGTEWREILKDGEWVLEDK